MRNEFLVEQYAHEKHQAHLREAAHDRLLHILERQNSRAQVETRARKRHLCWPRSPR
jgi:hypothetical protein